MCAESTAAPPPTAAIPLYLFAKAPRAGRVKTRLQPHLSATKAAQVAELMLAQTLANARRHWPGETRLWVWPRAGAGPGDAALARLAAEHGVAVGAQVGRDLGARLAAALADGIAGAGAGAAAVMGCDVPHCPGAVLAAAHAMLTRGENPVGASEDGGFYFIGLRRGAAEPATLFRGVDWSAPAVLRQVRARAANAGARLADLPTLRDIDRYADLRWLAATDAAYRPFVDCD